MKKFFLIFLFFASLTGCNQKESKLDFKVIALYCYGNDISKNLVFTYKITNNYEKDVEYIDASMTTKDVFDKKILSYKLLKKAPIKANKSKLFKAGIENTYGDECSNLSDTKFKDLKISFKIKQIAFSDQTVIKFGGMF